MPALGMAQETGKLLRWIKAEGETVRKGEPLMEVETDKVTVEIEAPANGILGGVSAAEGEDIPVGQAIAFILAEGEAAPEVVDTESPLAVAAPAASNGGSGQFVVSDTGTRPDSTSRRTLASPKARRLAREHGVPIEEIAGSGPYGAVQAADVLAFTTSSAADVAVPSSVPDERDGTATPLQTSRAWQVMAERMQQSWSSVPHFYLQRDVDATRLNSWRDAVRGRAGHEKVTHTDLLVKVCAAALAGHPRVNAQWVGNAAVAQGGINVGIAVATEDALIVPVVHRADRLTLKELATRRGELVSRAREKKLRPDDVSGGTFTISNLGMFGVDAFHAIVNTPQAAILAVGRILDKVVAVNGAAVVRPTLTLTLSFDHRVVDGAEGARFLDTLAALVEEPAGLVV
jgi:pyruvate dehydrogenase E2 component (dihydrolipoamide acetyltransferase)